MGDKQQTKKGGGSRKIGRNSKKCDQYRLENRREINKRRRAKKLELKYIKNKKRKEINKNGGEVERY